MCLCLCVSLREKIRKWCLSAVLLLTMVLTLLEVYIGLVGGGLLWSTKYSKFVNFHCPNNSADIVALRLLIAVAASWSVASRQSVSLWPAGTTGGPQAD